MKRLLTIVILLAWPTMGWGAEFGYHPGTPPATLTGIAAHTKASVGHTTTALRHTASSGDVLDSVYVYGESGDRAFETLLVAIYTVDVGNGKPDDRVIYDSLPLQIGAGWRGVDFNFSMTAGVTYCIAVAGLNSIECYIYRDAGSSEDAEDQSTVTIPDPWGSEGSDNSFQYGFYGVVTSSGAAAPMTVGGNTTNGGSLTQ